MGANRKWLIEPLSPKFNRQGFSCGNNALDEYLKLRASQDIKKRVARVFVAFAPENSDVNGYYTLSATSFRKDSLPAEAAKKLPHYPVPAALIGRLAVDIQWQGKGLGKFLLMNALERILHASRLVAFHAVIVEAKGEKAKPFYQQYGFLSFPQKPFSLFIPLKTVEQLLQNN